MLMTNAAYRNHMTRWSTYILWCYLSVLFIPCFALPADVPPELAPHLQGIAALAQPSPLVSIPAGSFLMGTKRRDADAFHVDTQYDDTEFPQRRIWVNAYKIDQYEVTLGEFLAFLQQDNRPVSDELQELIWHLIDVHYIPDQVLAPWPALYVTWQEASAFCHAQGKRLPTEAEWEKAARGLEGRAFPWGQDKPTDTVVVFGQYHMHQIPLVAAVDSYPEGQSVFGVYHMAGNVAEWVADWFGSDYYPIMPERNPPGPKNGRYKSVRGGSWKSKTVMLRTATRGGAFPQQREATIGFRCAQ
ncbi:MAG: hypothetical protein NPIRA02_24450 [Nitrospirales bacterium]|nr:MAG: hypothetical protein NPIRA02_24450 [Nitrospirales bacterium]